MVAKHGHYHRIFHHGIVFNAEHNLVKNCMISLLHFT